MAKSIWGSDNKTGQSTITATTGVVSAQFPLDNIKEDQTTQYARLSGSTAVLRFELAEDSTVDTIMMVPSNLDGFGFTTASIKVSTTSDFSMSTARTVAINPEYGFAYVFIPSAVTRFVELTCGSTGSFVEISKIFIGERIEVDGLTLSREDFNRSILRNDEISENIIGNRFVNVLNNRDRISGTYPFMEIANFNIIEQLYITHGSYKPVWIMLDEQNQVFANGQFRLSMYCYFNNTFSHDIIGGGYFNVATEYIEAI